MVVVHVSSAAVHVGAALQKETSQRDALLGAASVHDACDEQSASEIVVVVYPFATAVRLIVEPRSHGVQISGLCRGRDFCWEDHFHAHASARLSKQVLSHQEDLWCFQVLARRPRWLDSSSVSKNK